MTLEQIVRLQAARTPQPPVAHVVVWSGALERAGQTFSLHGDGWHGSQLANGHARVDQGSAGRVGSGVR